jgi:hypothetical protein
MITRIARLAGAIVVFTEVGGEIAHYLVGNTKVPCDWAAAGFDRPKERDAKAHPYVRLAALGAIRIPPPYVHVATDGEAAARLLAERLLVARNGSVSERLWRLVTGETDEGEPAHLPDAIDARWLTEIPEPVWAIVRDAVLRCL